MQTRKMITINEEKIQTALARAITKRDQEESRMRRSFNAWEKLRRSIVRYEKLLEKAAAQRAASRKVWKVKLKKGATPETALPQLNDLLPPSTLDKIVP